MPSSPDIVLAVLGALLVLVGIVGRIQAEKLSIGLSTARSRLLAAITGVVCLSLSICLYSHRSPSSATNREKAANSSNTGLQEVAKGTERISQSLVNPVEPDLDRKSIMEGEWNITIESELRIVWKMTASLVMISLPAAPSFL